MGLASSAVVAAWLTTLVAVEPVAASGPPAVAQFGASIEELTDRLSDACSSLVRRADIPPSLPTARQDQVRFDCDGLDFAGRPRTAAFVFGDGRLDMVSIATDPDERAGFIGTFTELYGPPAEGIGALTMFLDAGAGVSDEPSQVFFMSDRLVNHYRLFMSFAR